MRPLPKIISGRSLEKRYTQLKIKDFLVSDVAHGDKDERGDDNAGELGARCDLPDQGTENGASERNGSDQCGHVRAPPNVFVVASRTTPPLAALFTCRTKKVTTRRSWQ